MMECARARRARSDLLLHVVMWWSGDAVSVMMMLLMMMLLMMMLLMMTLLMMTLLAALLILFNTITHPCP